jgi:hypothetical protein
MFTSSGERKGSKLRFRLSTKFLFCSYDDFKKVDPRFDFSKTPEKVFKVMAMKI